MWCKNQGRCEEADLFFAHAVAIGERILGPDHPSHVLTLNNQANSFNDQGA
ncbi:unnamed protein product [Sphacelaria rigidula]